MAVPTAVPRRGGGSSALVGASEREAFERDGAVILPDLLTQEEVRALRECAEADPRTAARPKKIWVVDECDPHHHHTYIHTHIHKHTHTQAHTSTHTHAHTNAQAHTTLREPKESLKSS